jgi:uncharacterized protein
MLVDDLTVHAKDGLTQGEVDGHPYVFSPHGPYGVVLLTKDAYDVLACCAKGVSISDIKALVPWTRKDPGRCMDTLTWLATRSILDLGSEFSGYLAAQREKRQKREMIVWLQMTDACNLQCGYCYIPKKPTRMAIETGKKLMSKIAKECNQDGYDYIQYEFAGGEPTLRWEAVRELIDWANSGLGVTSPKAKCVVLTNGTAMPPDLIEYAVDGKTGISMSLDGVQQWHDKNRFYLSGQGSFRDVDKSLDMLLRRGVKPGISTTITSQNVKGLTELVEYCLNRDLGFRFAFYRKTPSSPADLECDHAELIYELKRCYEWIENHLPTRTLYRVHRLDDMSLRIPRSHFCAVGKDTIALTTDGKACLCAFDIEDPIGNGMDDNILHILKNQKR